MELYRTSALIDAVRRSQTRSHTNELVCTSESANYDHLPRWTAVCQQASTLKLAKQRQARFANSALWQEAPAVIKPEAENRWRLKGAEET